MYVCLFLPINPLHVSVCTTKDDVSNYDYVELMLPFVDGVFSQSIGEFCLFVAITPRTDALYSLLFPVNFRKRRFLLRTLYAILYFSVSINLCLRYVFVLTFELRPERVSKEGYILRINFNKLLLGSHLRNHNEII